MTRDRITPYLALGLLIMACSCSGKADEDAAVTPVALVTLARAETGGIDQTVSVYGITDNGAAGTSALVAPIEAIVGTIDAPVGTAVVRGQAVANLLPSSTTKTDAVKVAADARMADAALARARRLRGNNLNSDADVETAVAAARAADAALANATAANDKLVLRAPQAGYVTVIAQSPGDQVAAGANVAIVASTLHLRGRFGVDPALASHIAIGAAIHVVPAEGPAFDAHVVSTSPVVDPTTRLAPVIIDLPNGTGLGSGQALHGDLSISSETAALTIPYAALLDDGGQPYVFVVKAGVAHRSDVKTGPQSGDRIAIATGVHSGDMVVVTGGTALDDGMKVRTQ